MKQIDKALRYKDDRYAFPIFSNGNWIKVVEQDGLFYLTKVRYPEFEGANWTLEDIAKRYPSLEAVILEYCYLATITLEIEDYVKED